MPVSFEEAIDQISSGKKTAEAMASEMITSPGGDRQDLPDAALAAGFQATIAKFQSNYPYIDSSWVDRIADELKSGTAIDGIRTSAEFNRGQYLDKAKVDAGGSWDTWDAILRALDANYQAPRP